eukprot:scaffold13460_cov116-Isochrysis_galbana.AAC.2
MVPWANARNRRNGYIRHLILAGPPLDHLAHEHEGGDGDIDRHRGEPSDHEKGYRVAVLAKWVNEGADHQPDGGHLQKLPQDEGNRLGLRVTRLDAQQGHRVGQRAFGQQLVRAVPYLAPIRIMIKELETVVRGRHNRPRGEQRHVHQHQRANVSQEDEERHPDVAQLGINQQPRHPPQLGDHSSEDERVAQKVKPDLLHAGVVEPGVPAGGSNTDRRDRRLPPVVMRGYHPCDDGQYLRARGVEARPS